MLTSEAEHCAGVEFRFHSAARYTRDLLHGDSAAQAGDRKPDGIVLFGSFLKTNCDIYSLIHVSRERCGCAIAAWTTEDPYEFDRNNSVASLLDRVFTNDRNTAGYYSQPNVTPLPLGAAENIHVTPHSARDCEVTPDWDFVFCGAAFENRIQVIEGLSPVLEKYRTLIVGNSTHGTLKWPTSQFNGITFQETLPYAEVLGVYRNSKIVLNLSRSLNFCNSLFDITPSTPAPRTYEVAAMGIAQAAFYDRPELLQDFSPDQIAVFTNLEEFESIADRLLRDTQARREMAGKARAQALAHHLYRHRLQTLASALLPNAAIPDSIPS